MPGNCAVAGCDNSWRNDSAKDLSYHRLPKDEGMRKIWITRCCRKDSFNCKNATKSTIHVVTIDEIS